MRTKLCLRVIALFGTCLFYSLASHFMLRAQTHDGRPAMQTAQELLVQAEQLTNIRVGDVPSFRLTAQVEAFDEKGKSKQGTYVLLWNSPTMWREEIAFPDFSQTRLARINKLLISRKPATPTEDVYRVGKLIDFPSLLQLGIRDQIQGLHEKTKDGSSERRVDITLAGSKPWKKVYFEGSAPVPTQIEYKGAALGTKYPYKDFDLKFQLEDYMEFHGLQFPRTLLQFESNVLKDQVQLQEWSGATFGESDFVPPDDSHWIGWCPHVVSPTSRTQIVLVNPDLPPQLRTGGPPSRVVIYGIIGTDGQWHNIEAVKSEGSLVDSFWIGLMRKQRFEPAHCGEVPVEYEMMIEFDYP